jgi:predicted dehydrogenase
MKTVKWGIIGCGDVTEVKSGPAFNKVANSELVAVMRRDAEKAADYAKRHRVPRWYKNADQLINDPEVNAVYIATPPAAHMEYTLKVADAGKAVYVEKPMALTYNQCIKMIQACRNAGVPLYVAYYRRRLPAYLKVKELVENGAVGDVRFVKITHFQPNTIIHSNNLPWRVLPEISGGGIFLDMGSHTIDILDFILGSIKKVDGEASNQAGHYPAEDMVTANFTFESGVQGIGVWCFTAFETKEINEIVGSKGSIKFSCFHSDEVLLKNSDGNKTFKVKNPENIQLNLIHTVVHDIIGIEVCPSKGESGARATWVMDQILYSWREKNNLKFLG